MAKKSARTADQGRRASAVASNTPEPEEKPAEKLSSPTQLRPRDYVLLNVLFDAFCLVQLVLARLILRETRGLYFFFAVLILGFLLVSVFDYLYERSASQERTDNAPETP